MLILQCKDVDICKVSKMLIKYNLRASITCKRITLEGDVTDEVLTSLLTCVDVNVIQNFEDAPNSSFNIDETQSREGKNTEVDSNEENAVICMNNENKAYECIYNTVKQGEIYLCDLGPFYGCEQGGMRPVIIVRKGMGSTTIVVPLTSKTKKKNLPMHYMFKCSQENLIGKINPFLLKKSNSVILAEQIRVVDKRRLRQYLGEVTPDLMQKVIEKIDIALELENYKNTTKVETSSGENTEKVIYRDRIIYKQPIKEKRDINLNQIQILSKVNINELLTIGNSIECDEKKAKRIMELFGFDFSMKSTELLFKAIIVSPKDEYFNLKTLAHSVIKEIYGVSEEQVEKHIVAVIKETLKMKKVPAIDFIRLVNRFLTKREEEQND